MPFTDASFDVVWSIWVLEHIPNPEARLTPNFTEYWQADAGAVNDLDVLEVARWFESRGDTCLSCSPGLGRYLQRGTPLEIRRGP
jgi:hypothetical protein